MGQNLSFWQQFILLASGTFLGVLSTTVGAVVLNWLQARRENRRTGREAVADGEYRISRICSLSHYGGQITDNDDEEFKLSHACADELDQLARLLFAGPNEPPPETEGLLREGRALCNRWQVLATKLDDGTDDQRRERGFEIGELAAQIYSVAIKFRPVLRDVWSRR